MIGCAALFLSIFTAQAQNGTNVRISIIIDDMGDQRQVGLRAIQLPGPVTYAFLPHTPYSKSLANAAHSQGKEVMLHLPMQAMKANLLGPGGLTLDMSRKRFNQTLHNSLASVPHVVGINNHMGSLLTRHPGHMKWLMEEIKQLDNLYFIDSRTTHHTVATQLAREHQIPTRERDVFLDDDPNPNAITKQFTRLIEKAIKHGSAVGIGHPYESTLDVLTIMLPRLEKMGIELVPASELVEPAIKLRLANKASPDTIPGPLVFNRHSIENDSEFSQPHHKN